MSEKYFKYWTLSVILLELFFIYQMFFSNLTRFTIGCAYLTNFTLMFCIWHIAWDSHKILRADKKKFMKWTSNREV